MGFLKKTLKNYIGVYAYIKLAEAKKELTIARKTRYMDENLYVVLQDLFPDKGYYVDIGSNDGRKWSNTFHLEKELDWTGILVEPVLHLYFESKKLRSPKNRFVNAACVDFEYNSANIKLLYCDLMSVAPEISSHDAKKWAGGGEPYLGWGESIQETWAPAITLDSILEINSAPKIINFLSIDVEGAEYAVLSGVDFSKYEFSVICTDCELNSPAYNLLMSKNYVLHQIVGGSMIFLSKNFSAGFVCQ